MKNNYEKYIDEVRELKERNYNDFVNSNYTSYIDYLQNELAKLNISVHYNIDHRQKELSV